MVTGKFKCPICNKFRSYMGKCEQSILKVDINKITAVSKLKIYNHVCMGCFNKIKQIVNLNEVTKWLLIK